MRASPVFMRLARRNARSRAEKLQAHARAATIEHECARRYFFGHDMRGARGKKSAPTLLDRIRKFFWACCKKYPAKVRFAQNCAKFHECLPLRTHRESSRSSAGDAVKIAALGNVRHRFDDCVAQRMRRSRAEIPQPENAPAFPAYRSSMAIAGKLLLHFRHTGHPWP